MKKKKGKKKKKQEKKENRIKNHLDRALSGPSPAVDLKGRPKRLRSRQLLSCPQLAASVVPVHRPGLPNDSA